MRFVSRLINVKGELFSSTFTYGVTAIIKLGSSLVLTRLLNPEAYGVFAILLSITFTVELLSDVGTVGLLIRHARGGEPKFIHTVWTVRLIRGCMNFLVLYSMAQVIADFYQMEVLTDSLRVLSLTALIKGMESMSFVLMQRDQRSRIFNYAELVTNGVMTVVVIGLASLLGNHYAFIYGLLLQRLMTTIVSHFYYRDIGVAIAFDREAMADQFQFAKFVLPSSLLTIALSQYDKVVLLKLFDLSLLGIYGLAGNMIGVVSGLIMRNSRVVLYARCADYFRTNRATAKMRYYTENTRLLWLAVLLPAIVAGFSQSIIAILFDNRYSGAGIVLMVFGLGALSASFQNASENLLVASGRTRVVLVANLLRLFTIVPFTLLGYYLFGFDGFLWFSLAASIPVQFYFHWEQRRQGLLDVRAELVRFGWALLTFALCLAVSTVLLQLLPPYLLHLGSKRH